MNAIQCRTFSISAGIDFSLMSMADVSVLSYGTYGSYASFLTKEKIRYYPKGEEQASNEITDWLPSGGLQERGVVVGKRKRPICLICVL